VFDMSDAGTGKTGVHITAFAKRREKRGGKALVLAPRSLLANAWEKDIVKFAPQLTTSIAYASNRKQALSKDVDVLITNHDAVNVLTKLPPAFWKKFDTLIIDESTAFKHHTSGRSKSIAKIKKYFRYRATLSATPTSNGITDIWHQVNILDDGKRLGTSFFAFRAAVCVPQQGGFGATSFVKWTDKVSAEPIVAELLKDITIRHKFEECVDIPKNNQYPLEFTLNKKHMDKYIQLEKDSVLILSSEKIINAVNAAVLYGKLLQLSSGAVYSSAGDYTVIDSDRYELVLDLVEARPHSIVFFNWQHQKDQLVTLANQRKLSYAVFDGETSDAARSHIVDQYQGGVYRVLFAHPQSAGHGLTLTKSTATIWASPTANLEHFIQGSRRIYRIGQKQRTENIVIVAPDTIETAVYKSLLEKDVKMSGMLAYLKDSFHKPKHY